MLVARVDAPGKPLHLVDVPIPPIKAGEVLIRVKACGVCHSDLHIVDGDWSHEGFPRVPGHEVAGVVETVMPPASGLQVGDRVGLPWVHATCGHCPACERNDGPLCPDKEVTGLTVFGGFGEFVIAPASSVTKIPEAIPFEVAAPLFCAGLTSFSALKLAQVAPGERVAIQGIGGLGHLAIQFAHHLGAEVVALTTSPGKARAAAALGADHCLVGDPKSQVGQLMAMDGASVILSTSPDPASVSPLIGALSDNGRMVIVGAGAGEFCIRPKELIKRRLRIMGSPVGTHEDMRNLLDFVIKHRIRVEVSCYPLTAANRALEELRRGTTQFRIVLIPGEIST